jgi:hypothetical protein
MTDSTARTSDAKRHTRVKIALVLLVFWAVIAYLFVPLLWKTYFAIDPKANAAAIFDGQPTITETGDGHPGDPINLAIVGSDRDLVVAMNAAKWEPADPLSFDSSVRIAVDSVFRRPDEHAPVSSLFLFKRKQDFAFEQEIGDSPRQRRHVRFWKSDMTIDGRPLWLGAATLDERVGLSHTTAQVTHHIAPNVDEMRDLIVSDLEKAKEVERLKWIDGFHKTLEGKNGGGDPWKTDGRLAVIELVPAPPTKTTAPATK